MLAACAGLGLRQTPPVASPRPLPPAPVPASVAKLAEGSLLFDDLGTLHRSVTAKRRRAAVVRSGTPARLRVQPRRSGALVRPGRAARSDVREVRLGRRPDPGAQRQHADAARAAPAAWERSRRRAIAASPTAVEQALIGALAARYPPLESIQPCCRRARCVHRPRWRDVAQSFRPTIDVQVLVRGVADGREPWRLWPPDGTAAPGHRRDRGDAGDLARSTAITRARTTTTSTRWRPRPTPRGRCPRPRDSRR